MDEQIIDENSLKSFRENILKQEIFDVFRKSGNKPLSEEEIETILEVRKCFDIARNETEMVWEWFFRDCGHEMIKDLLPMLRNNNYSPLEIAGMFNIKYSAALTIRQMVMGRRKPFAEWVYWIDAKGNMRRSRSGQKRPLLLTYAPLMAIESSTSIKESLPKKNKTKHLR